MRNIFLEKSYTKCDGETILRPFFKKSNLNVSLDQESKVIQFVFIVCQFEGYRYILKLSCRPLAFNSYKAFLRSKERSWTSLPASFSAGFLKNYISLNIFCSLSKFHALVRPLFRELLDNICIVIIFLTRLWRHIFWN